MRVPNLKFRSARQKGGGVKLVVQTSVILSMQFNNLVSAVE